ncbi:murein hydrolase activator NlpD [[Haemophilus] felis]|nr:murein hydrolase activator NlpD [[Haemophilus] felis]
MKKSFLILPVSFALLTACSSSEPPAPIERVGETLEPGMVQPVGGGANGSWVPHVQQNNQMPVGMNQPTQFQPPKPVQTVSSAAIPDMATHFQIPRNPVTNAPDYSKIVKGSYPALNYKVSKGDTIYLISYISGLSQDEIARMNNLSAPYNLKVGQVLRVKKTDAVVSTSGATNAPQTVQVAPVNFEVPRNPTTNAPDYSKIDKGFYKASEYKVRKGDTMYLIAYISGLDVKELAAMNNMKEPYRLSVGQVLRVSNGSIGAPTNAPVVAIPTPVAPTATAPQPAVTVQPAVTTQPVPPQPAVTTQPAIQPQPLPSVTTKPVLSNVSWQWPTQGNIVQGFSRADGGNKGIDIAGSRGQAVNAAAGGRVVYAGNALRGYGNLIIIKHNDDYLSAYAHNESILVKDQQEVKAGQQIAKMGSSGTSSVKLHFEIRYKGKSVDPTGYLPKR